MADLVSESRRLGELRIDRSRPQRRRLARRWILVAVLALAALAALAVVLTRPPMVSVVEVRAAQPGEDVTELSAAGYVVSRRRSIIAPKIPGRLVRVLVEEGEAVQEGQELAKLDDRDARVALARAGAARQTAAANLARAKVSLAQASLDLRRTSALAASGAVSTAVLDEAKTTHGAAQAAVRASEAELSVAEAAVKAAELDLSYTVVRAPFAGTVVRKLADEGAMLAPAAVTAVNVGGILELVDLSALEVEAEVSEDRLHQIHEQQPALITLDAYPDEVFRGSAETVRPAVDRSKATAVVKVRFEHVPGRALPDMGAKVAFLSKPVDPAALAGAPRLRVPASAVVARDGKDVVFVLEGDHVVAVPVEIAARGGSELTLKSGPAPGTKLAVTQGRSLHDGQRVRIEASS